MRTLFLSVIILAAIFCSCITKTSDFKSESWGNVDNKDVFLYTLSNQNGMVVKLTNYGGIITSVMVPDRNGLFEDVVLGFDNLQQYTEPNPCFGATIGRFANRIRNAQFTIDSVVYHLDKNDGDHCLHGALELNTVVWDAEKVEEGNIKGVRFHYFSPDGTKGFPGNLEINATYLLSDDNEIIVRFEAETDKATHVSLTQHSYFNLNAGKNLIYDHKIRIDADQYTEIDEYIIPTGKIGLVKGTDWDLTKLTRIGDNIRKLNHNGYHFCYVFNKEEHELKEVIHVVEPKSGRTLSVSTTQPGVQFYSGNAISDELVGKGGKQYGPHAAFCLETQHLPDTPNHPNFPSSLLRPGEKYEEVVIYKFSTSTGSATEKTGSATQ